MGDGVLFGRGIFCVLQVVDGFFGGDGLQRERDHLLVGVVDGFGRHIVGGYQSRPGRHQAEAGGFVTGELAHQSAAGARGVADVVEQLAAVSFCRLAGTGQGEIKPFAHDHILAKGEVADHFAKGFAFDQGFRLADDEVGGIGVLGAGKGQATLVVAFHQMGKDEGFAG